MTIARERIQPPLTRSPILTLTTSHPRSLLSIARSNIARSRSRGSRSSQNRIAQTCCGFSSGNAPDPWSRPRQGDRRLLASHGEAGLAPQRLGHVEVVPQPVRHIHQFRPGRARPTQIGISSAVPAAPAPPDDAASVPPRPSPRQPASPAPRWLSGVLQGYGHHADYVRPVPPGGVQGRGR
jgi:hypothetical protein